MPEMQRRIKNWQLCKTFFLTCFWWNLCLKIHCGRNYISLTSLSFYILWMISFPFWTIVSLFSLQNWEPGRLFPWNDPFLFALVCRSGSFFRIWLFGSSPGVYAHCKMCTSSREKKKGINLVFGGKNRFTAGFSSLLSLGVFSSN